MLQKNKTYKIKITDISSEALGIGKTDGMVVFVANAVIGDELIIQIVKCLKNYAYGIIREIVTPSEYRIPSDCPVSSKCGGCSLRSMTYKAECDFKQKRVDDCIKRIGGLNCPVSPLVSADKIDCYRNKAQYPIAEQNGKTVSGFFAPRSHRVVSSEFCRLHPPVFSEILKAFLDFSEKHKIKPYDFDTGSGTIRHLYLRKSSLDNSVLVCIVLNALKLPFEKEAVEFLTSKFPQITGIVLNYHPEKNNVVLGKKDRLLYGKPELEDVLAGVRLKLSHHSFYQVNHAQTEKLYHIAKQFALTASSTDILLDLYCGAGSIGLSMADSFRKIIGVEVVPEAVENAKCNAELNGTYNAEFYCMDASCAAQKFSEQHLSPDVVVLDPPRKGCSRETVNSVAEMLPEKIVMISCNPATCARDLAEFATHGYIAQKIVPVDLFPRTTHVECVVLLSKVQN